MRSGLRLVCLLGSSGVILAACGRSGLDEGTGGGAAAVGPGGAGGGSGTTSSASSASGSSSGSGGTGGGGGPACTTLVQAGPALMISAPNGQHARRPSMVRSSDDGSQVTLLFESAPAGGPMGGPSAVRHVSLSPWGAWPGGGDLGPGFLGAPQGGASFAAASAPGGRFGLLHASYPNPQQPAHGMLFEPDMVPLKDGPTKKVAVSPDADQALFVATQGERHLLGFHRAAVNGWRELGLGMLKVAGDVLTYDGALSESCSTAAPAASAVATPDGWLLAFSKGTGLHAGCLADVPPGPPNNLGIASFSTSDGLWHFGAELEGTQPIARLAMIPRAAGAWMAWSRDSGAGATPISVAQIDPLGQVELAITDITGPADVPLDFGADRLGEGLALAWINDAMNNPPDIAVQVIGADGAIGAHAAFEPPTLVTKPLAVLGSPNGDAILVAWQTVAAGGAAKITVLRLDCVTAE